MAPNVEPSKSFQQLYVTEIKSLRWSGGVILKCTAKNEHCKVTDISGKLRENGLQWYGRVMGRNEERMRRTVVTIEQPKRHRRPPMT